MGRYIAVAAGRLVIRPVPWLKRVRVTNYRSIASCDVTLGPLTVLVGPNGSGKSNFLDALMFVSQAVATTPYQAIEARGGLAEILRRAPEPAESFTIYLDVAVPWGPLPDQVAHGEYGFTIAVSGHRQRPFEVLRETCTLSWRDTTDWFSVTNGAVDDPWARLHGQPIETDRLYLPAASARPNLAPLFVALRGIQQYNLNPSVMRIPQPQTEGSVLGQQGEHLGDVLGLLDWRYPEAKQRIDTYLAAITPGVEGIDRLMVGMYMTLEMRQRQDPGGPVVTFGPDAMSDGTIRAAGILAALFQPWVRDGRTSLVAIEEPETALHPAASGVLFDALTEASEVVQVVAASQSSDLFDREDIDPAIIRAVASDAQGTVIDNLDEASSRILHEKYFTLGQLMRANQLSPRRRPHEAGPAAA